jgi:uncharacterized membrane protein YidH (DUF202 family)
VTLMKTGLGLVLAGIGLAVFGSRAELQAINQALTRRLKTSIALVLAGIGLTLIGLRMQGQIVFRRVTGPIRRSFRQFRARRTDAAAPGGDRART